MKSWKLLLLVFEVFEKSTLKPVRNLSFEDSGKVVISTPGHFYREA